MFRLLDLVLLDLTVGEHQGACSLNRTSLLCASDNRIGHFAAVVWISWESLARVRQTDQPCKIKKKQLIFSIFKKMYATYLLLKLLRSGQRKFLN